MAFKAGVCTRCSEYILLKENIPFVVCPKCTGNVSGREAAEALKVKCNDKDKINDIIADCIALEVQYGPKLPFMVLAMVADNFPRMESPAYLLVKLAGFDTASVRMYLDAFAGVKSDPKNVPWAKEFLDNAVAYRNMEFAPLFVSYIENKLGKDDKEKYLNKVDKLKKEYTVKSDSPEAVRLLMMLYVISAVVNVLLLPFFLLTDFHFGLNILIAIAFVCAEVGLMSWHHKVFGNKLGMTDRERLWMTVFMCSLFFAFGAGIIGSVPTLQIRF